MFLRCVDMPPRHPGDLPEAARSTSHHGLVVHMKEYVGIGVLGTTRTGEPLQLHVSEADEAAADINQLALSA